MQVQLSSGNYDIIASGDTFLFHDAEELSIRVNGNKNDHIHIVLLFQNDASGQRRIKASSEKGHLLLTCYNFSHHEGIGLSHPTHIADIDGKAVYLTFWTKLDGSKPPYTRSVRFTIFQEQ